MKTPKSVAALAVFGACATLLAATAGPASAKTSSGIWDDFFVQCDASVYVPDSLTGSPGKVEAWGGYSCPTSFKFIGEIKLQLKNGNTAVKTDQKNVNASTGDVNATVTNSSGTQNWHADLTIFRPGFDSWIVSTGIVAS